MISPDHIFALAPIGPVDPAAPLPEGTVLAVRGLSGQDLSDLVGLAAGRRYNRCVGQLTYLSSTTLDSVDDHVSGSG